MSKITNPYLVYKKDTGEPIIIQRDGYYPPEVQENLVSHSIQTEINLINSGYYQQIMDTIINGDTEKESA